MYAGMTMLSEPDCWSDGLRFQTPLLANLIEARRKAAGPANEREDRFGLLLDTGDTLLLLAAGRWRVMLLLAAGRWRVKLSGRR